MCKFCGIKCWFIFFNSLFMASGIALITIGAVQYSTYSQIRNYAGNALSRISVVLIVVSVAMVLVSILGHVGAFMNNSSLVACFISLLILIILLEVLMGAAFYTFFRRTPFLQVNSGINTKARVMIYDYSPESQHSINRIQEKFRCCGADSYTDWYRSVGWGNPKALPGSCCVVKSEDCGQDKKKVHTQGCILAIKLFLLKNLLWLSAVCIALGIGEIFGVIIGVFLCLEIKRKNYEHLS